MSPTNDMSELEWSAQGRKLLLESGMGDGSGDEVGLALERGTALSRFLARKSVCWARDSLQRLPIRLTLENVGMISVVVAAFMPRPLTYLLLYPLFRLVFGTLYPAYASYKAVRTKNVKEYVKWMMYWIVFALFTCAETFTDVFFSFWFPFYYEIKIILVLWLLSPATKGSSILYRRFVHPALCRRETEIDEALARATEQGYSAVVQLGSKGVNYATTVLMQTAIKNLPNVMPSGSLAASQSDSAISSLASRRASPSRSETDGMTTRCLTTTSTCGIRRRRPLRRTKSEDTDAHVEIEQQQQHQQRLEQLMAEKSYSPSDSEAEEEYMDFDYNLPSAESTIDSVDLIEFKKPEPVLEKSKKPREDSVTRRKPRTRGQAARSFDSDFSD